MHHLRSCISVLGVAVVATLGVHVARADETVPAEPAQAVAAESTVPAAAQPQAAAAAEAVTGAKAPAAAYVVEENEASRVAKRQVPGGYKEVNVNDTVYWCQQKQQFGSRVKRETRCVTPAQYDQQMQEGQDYADKVRSGELNPASEGSWSPRT